MVVVVQLEVDPAPTVTAQVTATPEMGLELESLTTATRDDDTAEPTVADWPLPETTEILAAAPTVPAAVKVAGVATPVAVAVTVFVPAIVPVVKLHCACPDPFVVVVQLEVDPPPPVTAHVTVTPERGVEFESFTTAMSGEETTDPAVAVCPLPDKTEILVATPPVTVTVGKELVTALP